MQGNIVSTVLLPLTLAFIMFSLGLGLTLADFALIARRPRAMLVGVVCHFVVLPLVCFAVVKAFGITGSFAVGFMILAACPTGATSNLLTYIARGDVALALSFTAVASLVTIVTLPLIVSFALQHFSGSAQVVAAQVVAAPVGAMMGQVLVMFGLPVAMGMLVRGLKPALALRLEPGATRVATLLFVVIVVAAAAKNWALIRDNFASLAPLAIGLNLSMLAAGFVAAWLARLSRKQAVTLGIETAVQNATLALVIASSVLKQDAMAVPGVLYGVLMYAGGLLFAFGMRRFTTGQFGASVPTVSMGARP